MSDTDDEMTAADAVAMARDEVDDEITGTTQREYRGAMRAYHLSRWVLRRFRSMYKPTRHPRKIARPVDDEPMHLWFGLSYSSYLVLPRSVIQSMPAEWQHRLLSLIEDAQAHLQIDDMPNYDVRAKVQGKIVSDPFKAYDRGRRRIPTRVP